MHNLEGNKNPLCILKLRFMATMEILNHDYVRLNIVPLRNIDLALQISRKITPAELLSWGIFPGLFIFSQSVTVFLSYQLQRPEVVIYRWNFLTCSRGAFTLV